MMRKTLTAMAAAAGFALGLGTVGTAEAAGPGGSMNQARAALLPVHLSTAAELVEQVHYQRRGPGVRSRYRGPRFSQRRHFHRGGPSIQFHFGTRPRHYAPRYYVPPQRHVHRLSQAHIRWCYNRYRSYRSWDNSFQPYHGPRRQCVSPYS
jgi:hypothetical protein